MQSYKISSAIQNYSNNLYQNYAYDDIGFIGSFLLATSEQIVLILGTTLETIEHLSFTFLNLVGSFFSSDYSICDAIIHLEFLVKTLFDIPLYTLLSPLKILYQTWTIYTAPLDAAPFDNQ